MLPFPLIRWTGCVRGGRRFADGDGGGAIHVCVRRAVAVEPGGDRRHPGRDANPIRAVVRSRGTDPRQAAAGSDLVPTSSSVMSSCASATSTSTLNWDHTQLSWPWASRSAGGALRQSLSAESAIQPGPLVRTIGTIGPRASDAVPFSRISRDGRRSDLTARLARFVHQYRLRGRVGFATVAAGPEALQGVGSRVSGRRGR